MNDKLIQYSDAIRDFVKIHERFYAKKQRDILEGKYINVFTLWNEFAGITEPIHSRILQFLLSSSPMHGQRNTFINLLLERINVPYKVTDVWQSTAEKGRVDVMLKRFHPHGVVIIENKSNWANDQPNQLYRYWYENIHRSEEDCHPDYYARHPEYKVVYLIPNKDKVLSDNSIQRPIDYPKDLPEILPMEPLIFSFDKELADWFDACIMSLPKENTPLKNLITQYKEYCKKL